MNVSQRTAWTAVTELERLGYLIVVRRDVERRPVRVDLDHRAVAARRHERAFERAERDAAAEKQGSALGRLARQVADRARDLFHLREDEAREDEAERRAAHPREPLDRR